MLAQFKAPSFNSYVYTMGLEAIASESRYLEPFWGKKGSETQFAAAVQRPPPRLTVGYGTV